MKNLLRTVIAATIGLGTLMIGQLGIESVAWWWTGTTATFDDPMLNAVKFVAAGSAGLALAAMIGIAPVRRRRLL